MSYDDFITRKRARLTTSFQNEGQELYSNSHDNQYNDPPNYAPNYNTPSNELYSDLNYTNDFHQSYIPDKNNIGVNQAPPSSDGYTYEHYRQQYPVDPYFVVSDASDQPQAEAPPDFFGLPEQVDLQHCFLL